MLFSELKLKEELLKGLSNMHYIEMLPIQELSINPILSKQDVIIESQTGSGKTVAFLLPALQRINWQLRKVQTLIIAPTRELSAQIMEEADALGMYAKIQSVLLNGREKYEPQIQRLKRAHLACGTPGRIHDHIERGNMDVSHIQYVVLDEADVLLEMGFLPLVKSILDVIPKEATIVLASATMNETLQELIKEYMKEPQYLKNEIKTEGVLQEYVIETKEAEKLPLIYHYASKYRFNSVIVFCNRKETVESLYQQMAAEDVSVTRVHGDLRQKERYQAIESFRKGEYRFLIASDVAGRGLDIESVDLVIHYDLPIDIKKYIHRIGRSARLNRDGMSIAFVVPKQKEQFMLLETHFTKTFTKLSKEPLIKDESFLKSTPAYKQKKSDIARFNVTTLYLNGGKDKKIRPGDLVGAICQIDGIAMEDIGVIEVKQHGSYVEILNEKGMMVCKALQSMTIKKKKLRVEIAKKQKMER